MMIRENRSFKRRGLSTVIGAVFMIIVMAGAINVTLWTLQQQDKVTQTVIEKANSNLAGLNEKISISDIRVNSNKLNVTVSNSGGAAATVKSIYVVNETASPKSQYRYDLDLTVDGRNSIKDVGQLLPLYVKSDTNYSVKVVTKSGNTASSHITALSKVALPMSLYIIPPTVTPGTNATVLFAVTNNITDSNLGWAVTPTLLPSLGCSPPSSTCQLTQYVAPPSGATTIGKGSTVFFKWVYKVTAPDNTVVTFNASLANAKPGNYVIEKGLVKVIQSSQTSFSTEIIVTSTLVQKPEIFLIIPSPFGDSSDQGLWGVVIANPLGGNMEVSRVVMTMYSSKSTAGGTTEMIGSCGSVTPIYPTTAAEWTCPHVNMIEWKDVASPEVINGLESKSFLIKVPPGTLQNGSPEPSFMISVAVFTNMGQFTKTGYSSGMSDSSLSLGNVYLTDTTVAANALQSAHIFSHMNGITPASTVTVDIAMADFDTSSSTKIKSGTKLIVNVPRGFTVTGFPSYAGFVATPTSTPYSDGSTQIVAILNEDLGDIGTAEAKVLSFTVTAPAAPDPPSKRIYIMYTLLDGETTTNFSVGALAEIALQVNAS
jgi:hypothetical protein